MKVSDLIAELQKQLDEHGDRLVCVMMDGDQTKASDNITKVWPLDVSDRGRALIIDCLSIGK